MISELLSQVKEKEADRKALLRSRGQIQQQIEGLQEELLHISTAKDIILQAASVTQKTLSFHFSNVVTNALAAVFEDPYEFKADFVERRNVTECDLSFVKNDLSRNPLNSCGYGAADIAALASRVAYWKLEDNSRNTLILDEPTRNLSRDLQPLASLMIKKLSELLNLQFIIVTHNEDLALNADKVFYVEKDVYSTVQEEGT